MTPDPYRMGFHLMPPTGWLNDPNGCCQIDGIYHVFHQYSPAWPNDDDANRGWGHAWSRDLVNWHHDGWVLHASIDEDATGAWSGSAMQVDGKMVIYYTGNVMESGDHDYMLEGRQQNLLYVESSDGLSFGEKHVLMHNEDYPDYCALHVRDPFVWKSPDPQGDYHMVLGARDKDSVGFAMIYGSADGYAWEHRHDVRTPHPLGFMWECPNRVALEDAQGVSHEFLSICPQGLPSLEDRWQNFEQAGYLPLDRELKDAILADETAFVEWDRGFDFYAPQMLTDEQGRTLMFGWMGNFDQSMPGALPGMDWCGCLTVPRVLSLRGDGRILQTPAPELEALRTEELPVDGRFVVSAPEHRADIVMRAMEGEFSLVLDDVLTFSFADGVARLTFAEGSAAAAGRVERSCAMDAIRNLRLLVDSSCVEIFLNDGEQVFTTRWFPTDPQLTVRTDASCETVRAWSMGDGVRETYGG